MWEILRNLATISGIITFVTALAGLAAFFYKVMFIDRPDAALKRFDKFQQMRDLRDDPEYERVNQFIYGRTNELPSLEDRYAFMALFEQVALMVNSGLMKEEVVLYMFGYYAIKAYECQALWRDIDLDCPFWRLFKVYCERMKYLKKQYWDNMPVEKFQI